MPPATETRETRGSPHTSLSITGDEKWLLWCCTWKTRSDILIEQSNRGITGAVLIINVASAMVVAITWTNSYLFSTETEAPTITKPYAITNCEREIPSVVNFHKPDPWAACDLKLSQDSRIWIGFGEVYYVSGEQSRIVWISIAHKKLEGKC